MICVDCMAKTGREDFDLAGCASSECTSPLHGRSPR